jgi:hypothetical protein
MMKMAWQIEVSILSRYIPTTFSLVFCFIAGDVRDCVAITTRSNQMFNCSSYRTQSSQRTDYSALCSNLALTRSARRPLPPRHLAIDAQTLEVALAIKVRRDLHQPLRL